MVVVDGKGIPLGSTITSASPHEVTLVDEVMQQVRVPRNGPVRPKTRPKRLIADRAYDSDKLREKLKQGDKLSLFARIEKTEKTKASSC